MQATSDVSEDVDDSDPVQLNRFVIDGSVNLSYYLISSSQRSTSDVDTSLSSQPPQRYCT